MTTRLSTPAPWFVVPRDAPKGTLMIESANGLVAVMEHSKTRPVTYQAAEANAVLIAAAPELLNALCALHAAMACYDSTPEEFLALEQARETIAKATGPTP